MTSGHKNIRIDLKIYLSHDDTSKSVKMPCIKINKPLVVCIFSNSTRM